jgi:DNA-binding transcriptional MerR regulator
MIGAMDAETRLFSLAELADEADVTSRTIRYYIAQGLLPPPMGAGPTTRYSTGHLGRLRLVRELQRQHLPLAEIRARLEQLTDEEVAELTASFERRPTTTPAPGSALDYIRSLLDPTSALPARQAAHPRQAIPAPAAVAPVPMPKIPMARSASPPPPVAASPPASIGVREAFAGYADAPPAVEAGSLSQPGRSQWDRITLAPDIELHVRRPLSRIHNRAVDRLVGYARKLLEEDPS